MRQLLLILILAGMALAVQVNVPTWITNERGELVLSTTGVTFDPAQSTTPTLDTAAMRVSWLASARAQDSALFLMWFNARFPVGTLMFLTAWSDTTGLSDCWHLADGTGGTHNYMGYFAYGVLARDSTVGATGGQSRDTVTGTVAAPVFTGTAMATHTHAYGTIAVTAHKAAKVFASGTAVTGDTSATHTVSGSVAAISAGTPAGTNTAPALTGGVSSNLPPFKTVIVYEKVR